MLCVFTTMYYPSQIHININIFISSCWYFKHLFVLDLTPETNPEHVASENISLIGL